MSLLRVFSKGLLGWVLVSILLSALTIMSAIGLMGTSAYLIIQAGFQPSIAVLQVAIVGVRFFGISRAVFRYLERLLSHRLNLQILARIREHVFLRLSQKYPLGLPRFTSASLLSLLIQDIEVLENLFVRFLLPLASAILVTVFLGIFLGIYSFEIVLIMLVGFFLAGIMLPYLSAVAARQTGQSAMNSRIRYQQYLLDFLRTFQESLLYRQELNIFEEQVKLERKMANFQWRQKVLQSVFSNTGFIVTQLTALSVLIVGINLPAHRQIDSILLAVFYLMILASFEVVQNLAASTNLFGSISIAVDRIKQLDKEVPSASQFLKTAEIKMFPIEFDHVSYRYANTTRAALQNISLKIEAGQKIAVVGKNGSGKSTFIDVLLGLLNNYQGEIHFGGIDFQTIARSSVLAKTGFIDSQPYIFSTSASGNLLLANEMADLQTVKEVIRKVGLSDRLGEINDNPIEESGRNLSAGERERIEIGRMLLRDSEIYLLDEPLKNLDPVLQGEMRGLLREKINNNACIWITHQFDQMEYFDKILVFENGEIVEVGDHNSLMMRKGCYFSLYVTMRKASKKVMNFI